MVPEWYNEIMDLAEKRFWLRVKKYNHEKGPNDCWMSGKSETYGAFLIKGKFIAAHRLAWMIHHRKPIPNGLVACHSCDNPPCVNPAHIWIGTKKDNTQDALKKNRLKPYRGHV